MKNDHRQAEEIKGLLGDAERRSVDEIKRELKGLIEQYDKVKWKNPAAQRIIGERIKALCWVLKLEKPKRLTLTEEQIKFCEAFW